MKAAYYEKYGTPDVLSVRNIDKPVPKANEILIKVSAATVNRTDCAMLYAKPFFMRFMTGLTKPSKKTLGSDLSGVIESIGKEVSDFKVGDKIIMFDDNGIESQAEYTLVSMDKTLVKLPDNIDIKEAVSCIEGFHYAYNFLNKVNINSGQKVMVNGGTGSIGSALVQLCKYHELEITATCRSEHSDLLRSLGASKVIDYEKEDFTKQNKEFDFVFDSVGKSRFTYCKKILKPGGAYISSELGPNCENVFLSLFTSKFGSKKVKFPIPLNPQESLEFSVKLMSEGKFKAVIDRVYSIDKIKEAYEYVASAQKVGNVLIDMDK